MTVRIKSPAELERLREEIIKQRDPNQVYITVCGGTGCRAYGVEETISAFTEELAQQKLGGKVALRTTGCHGFCERGPLVVIKPQDILYQRVKASDVPQIIAETILKGNMVENLLFTDSSNGLKIVHEYEVPFYQKQK